MSDNQLNFGIGMKSQEGTTFGHINLRPMNYVNDSPDTNASTFNGDDIYSVFSAGIAPGDNTDDYSQLAKAEFSGIEIKNTINDLNPVITLSNDGSITGKSLNLSNDDGINVVSLNTTDGNLNLSDGITNTVSLNAADGSITGKSLNLSNNLTVDGQITSGNIPVLTEEKTVFHELIITFRDMLKKIGDTTKVTLEILLNIFVFLPDVNGNIGVKEEHQSDQLGTYIYSTYPFYKDAASYYNPREKGYEETYLFQLEVMMGFIYPIIDINHTNDTFQKLVYSRITNSANYKPMNVLSYTPSDSAILEVEGYLSTMCAKIIDLLNVVNSDLTICYNLIDIEKKNPGTVTRKEMLAMQSLYSRNAGLTGGTNISIENNVVSLKNNAGLTGGTNISIDDNVVSLKNNAGLTGGTNISIDDNVVSLATSLTVDKLQTNRITNTQNDLLFANINDNIILYKQTLVFGDISCSQDVKAEQSFTINDWKIRKMNVNDEDISDNRGTDVLVFEWLNSSLPDKIKGYIDNTLSGVETQNMQMNFTGQHRCVTNTFEYTEDLVGYIVSTGTNYKHINSTSQNKINNIKISESLPFVDITSKSKDKKVFGVISDGEDQNESSRTYQQGVWGSILSKNKDDNRIYINSVGEGAIWVSDFPEGKELESGDYITSSDIPGIGQRQDAEMLMNYTVAKITMDCAFEPAIEPSMTWNKETEQYQEEMNEQGNPVYLPEYSMKYIKLDGTIIQKAEYTTLKAQGKQVYRMAFVGCTYHCG